MGRTLLHDHVQGCTRELASEGKGETEGQMYGARQEDRGRRKRMGRHTGPLLRDPWCSFVVGPAAVNGTQIAFR